MASSEIIIEGIGPVKIFRRKGLKHLRVSVNSHGEVRLSIPWYVPKAVGVTYLSGKKAWILEHQQNRFGGWQDNHRLSERYTLRLHRSANKKITTKTTTGTFNIFIPQSFNSSQQQTAINKSVRNFLRSQSEELLIPRLNQIAKEHNFKVTSVRIKSLKSRWGSCDSKRNISLSSALITLDQEMIDYVICHELAHTRHMNHSKDFWQLVESLVPDYKQIRKKLKDKHTLP